MTTAKIELTKLIALLTGKSERDIVLTDDQVAGHIANIAGYVDLSVLVPIVPDELNAQPENTEPQA